LIVFDTEEYTSIVDWDIKVGFTIQLELSVMEIKVGLAVKYSKEHEQNKSS